LEKIEGVNVEPIIKEVAKALNIEYIDLDEVEIDMRLFSKVPYRQLLKYNTIPVEESDLNVLIVFNDPLDMAAQDAIQRLFPKKPIRIAIAKPKQINQYLQRLEINESIKGLVLDIRKDLSQEGSDEENDESPAVLKLIDIVLKSSIYAGASDIHIEATEKSCVIRERVDGMLRQSFTFDKDIFNPLASRMKLLTNLKYQRKIAAKVAGVGIDRVRFDPERIEEIEEAVTRRDISRLIAQGAITILKKKGTSRGRARARRGKRRGPGSYKGSKHARLSKKKRWMRKIRALRRALREMRDSGLISKREYRELYPRLSVFLSIAHLKSHVKRRVLAERGE
ncbi:MAG TPA: 50S ribosomal protein L19e, partial [Candidatus Korarchaeota archaeon]|nr:50S ribosomal protein L19e [Candidatus Korarchaeota archaeon]